MHLTHLERKLEILRDPTPGYGEAFGAPRTFPSIVFTNGNFDFLTHDHVELFKKAKSIPDSYVIVGISSDSSTAKLKFYPTMEYYDKVTILESIKYIDHVQVYNTEDSLPLITLIRPNILVLRNNNNVGEDFVNSYNGKVIHVKGSK